MRFFPLVPRSTFALGAGFDQGTARTLVAIDQAKAKVRLLLGAAEGERVLAMAPDTPGGVVGVRDRICAGWTVGEDGGWKQPQPLDLASFEEKLQQMVRAASAETAGTRP